MGQPHHPALRPTEASLYEPVKRFLERQGFEVKGEVHDCDLVGVRHEELVVVELKPRMNLTLVLQGVDRLKLTDLVYLAIAAPRRAEMGRWAETRQLCRRLGLGLLTVRPRTGDDAAVEVIVEPTPYRPRQNGPRRERLLGEFVRRSGDYNVGGCNRRPLVTAYREAALRLARELAEGQLSVRALRQRTGCDQAARILSHNHYGWFAREERGVYSLTPAGHSALEIYADILPGLPLQTSAG